MYKAFDPDEEIQLTQIIYNRFTWKLHKKAEIFGR
jgi:hypothetical protein